MPKVKFSYSAKLRGFVQEFGEQHLSTDGKIQFCKLCAVRVKVGKRFSVQQQCYTIKQKQIEPTFHKSKQATTAVRKRRNSFTIKQNIGIFEGSL
jgi:hypothetical protein